MANACCVGPLYRFFYPLDWQMLTQSAPVWRVKAVGKKVKSIVEHCRAG